MRHAADTAVRDDTGPVRVLHRVTTFEVRVRQLPVMARIGINPGERSGCQPLTIDVTLDIAAATPIALLADTVDYRQVAAAAEALAATHIDLIETYAHLLALRCLALGPVRAAEVVVAKPRALSQGCASARVRIER